MSGTLTIYILSGIIIFLLVWVTITEYRLRKFFKGSDGKSIETRINDTFKQVDNLKNTQLEINKHLVTVDARLDKSIRRVETLRFNPFTDGGSNQSFAISFLNDEGDGVVLSSLYARDRMSIFAKPIEHGKSEFELTIEEKEVLKKSQ